MAKRFNQNATKYTDHEKDVELFLSKVEEYFTTSKLYSISGLCLHIGISKSALYNYAKRDKYVDIVDYARLRIENQVEENALVGEFQHQVAIFTLKNNFGWTEKQTIEQHTVSENKNYNFDNLSKEEIKELLKGE